jgi:hypothetical protein
MMEKTKTVAVIALNLSDFEDWLSKNAKKNERYFRVSIKENLYGRVIHAVRKTVNAKHIPDLESIHEECILRIREFKAKSE